MKKHTFEETIYFPPFSRVQRLVLMDGSGPDSFILQSN